jgi:hypothetical protein
LFFDDGYDLLDKVFFVYVVGVAIKTFSQFSTVFSIDFIFPTIEITNFEV